MQCPVTGPAAWSALASSVFWAFPPETCSRLLGQPRVSYRHDTVNAANYWELSCTDSTGTWHTSCPLMQCNMAIESPCCSPPWAFPP